MVSPSPWVWIDEHVVSLSVLLRPFVGDVIEGWHPATLVVVFATIVVVQILFLLTACMCCVRYCSETLAHRNKLKMLDTQLSELNGTQVTHTRKKEDGEEEEVENDRTSGSEASDAGVSVSRSRVAGGHSPRRRRRSKSRLMCWATVFAVLVAVGGIWTGPTTMWSVATTCGAWGQWALATVGRWTKGLGSEHEHHGHDHANTNVNHLEEQWKQGADDMTYYSCIHREYDTGPTWVGMRAPTVHNHDGTPPTALVPTDDDRPVLRTYAADVHSRVYVLHPGHGAEHVGRSLDTMDIYLTTERVSRRRDTDRIDIVPSGPVKHVWRLAKLLHAIIHNLPRATVESMKHVALWPVPTMNETMAIYDFHCQSARIESLHGGPAVVHEVVLTENGDVDISVGPSSPIHQCRAKCAGFVDHENMLNCNCRALRCTTQALVEHNDIQCAVRSTVPHNVFHLMAET